MIEMVALVVLLAFPTGRTWGLDYFVKRARAAAPGRPGGPAGARAARTGPRVKGER
jgi:hypothetical protein